MCGEKMMKAGSNCAMLGSPPRMRGKGCRDKVKHCFHGITPAYAGKRAGCLSQCPQGWDHPRVCGEKSSLSRKETTTSGSPPRMRGKEAFPKFLHVLIGITPAYAGKRRQTGNQNHDAEDHPRVCGEKCFAISAALSEMGSPPRMRGKERILQARATKTRITPAYAGKSLHSTLVFCNRWDHPRVCGEKG